NVASDPSRLGPRHCGQSGVWFCWPTATTVSARKARPPASAACVALIAPDYSRGACARLTPSRSLAAWRPRVRARGFSRASSHVLGYRRARAHQIPIAEGVVDPAHARPVLARTNERQRERRLLARIWMGPLAGDGAGRVRGVLQDV